jgi:hypothetical protein
MGMGIGWDEDRLMSRGCVGSITLNLVSIRGEKDENGKDTYSVIRISKPTGKDRIREKLICQEHRFREDGYLIKFVAGGVAFTICNHEKWKRSEAAKKGGLS